jgi:hypothetical protein
MKKIFISAMMIALVSMTGCKKEESTEPVTPPAAPSIPTVTFTGPSASETHAQTANTYAQSMSGLMSSSVAFSYMPANQNGNVSTWTITAGGLTETFTSTKQNDGSYTWSFVVNGTDGVHTYSNWTYWTGSTSADGKSGSWTFYEYGHAYKVEELTYSTDANGTLTGTWFIYNSSGVLADKFIVINRADHSGEFQQYSDGTHMDLKVTWIAAGTGTWTTYNTSGTSTGSGTF